MPPGLVIRVGREAGPWSVPWDEHVSRQHIAITWDDTNLSVQVLSEASNPVFFQGTQQTTFVVRAGEHFVIGSTTFSVTDETASIAVTMAPPATEQTFSPEYLRKLSFRDPGHRLELLSRLPEQLTTAEDELLHERVVQAAFEGVRNATVVILCQLDPASGAIQFLYWDQGPRAKGQLQASQRLIHEAIQRQESVVHTWQSGGGSAAFTESDEIDWAFCTPFVGSSCHGWALYVAGTQPPGRQSPAIQELEDEMKFAEVMVTTVSSFREVRDLQKRQSALSQFFSAPVVQALAKGEPEEILAPREVDVTVLFCDLRGFSRETERWADDLFGLLTRVSDALGVLTREILAEGGVIGDFHGDAAMGFWGWPLGQTDAAACAARAAIAIRREFASVAGESNHSLANFKIGVGIASGRAVAGKIGTKDQVKITAFGPAVNLASRLEGMTKRLNAPMLMDAATAAQLESTDEMRLRQLARVQPYGMGTAIEVVELLPGEREFPLLTDEHIQAYEQALEAFQRGDWTTAWEALHEVPAADASKDFLTTYIASRNRAVPDDWDGVIRLDWK